MVRRGEMIENPITGEQITFIETARDTNGELLVFEDRISPGGSMPGRMQHTHPLQEERIEGISGTMSFKVRGRKRTLGPGEVLTVPPGVPHTWWNGSGEEAHVRAELRPALQTEILLETLCGLCRDAKTNKQGFPRLLQVIAMLHEYPNEGGFLWVPLSLQRTIISMFAPLARMRGYRGRYTEYSGRE